MSQNESSDISEKKQQLSGIFNRAAHTYDQVGPQFFSHFGRRIVEIARIPSGSKVLDVATGRGALLYPAAKSVGLDGHVTGIDLSESMVEKTRKALLDLKMSSNVKVCQMDAEHLQFPDERFDYVLCGFAIFFFPQLYQAMAEFRRVLKPNGTICVSTFDKLFYDEWDWFDKIVKTYIQPEPESVESPLKPRPVFETPEGLRAILNEAGFENIQIHSEPNEVIYTTAEELWLTLWSHGKRWALERIEQETGSKGLEQFKSEIFKKVHASKQADGFHQSIPAHIGLAAKPKT